MVRSAVFALQIDFDRQDRHRPVVWYCESCKANLLSFPLEPSVDTGALANQIQLAIGRAWSLKSSDRVWHLRWVNGKAAGGCPAALGGVLRNLCPPETAVADKGDTTDAEQGNPVGGDALDLEIA